MATTQVNRKFDFSGGLKTSVNRFLQKQNQLRDVRNATFGSIIGAVSRRLGYTQFRTTTVGSGGLGLYAHKFSTDSRLYAAANNTGVTNTRIFYDDNSSQMADLGVNGIAPNTRTSSANYLDELYIVGCDAGGTYMTPINVDSGFGVSTSRNIFGMPKCKWLIEYRGSLYAVNVNVNGTTYLDRAYKSSIPLGAITFIKNDQSGTLTSLTVDSVRYLKVGMTIGVYTAGTDTNTYTLAITGVDKPTDTITFSSASVTVSDNDEIWLTGRKNKLSILWNTDYPTTEDPGFLQIAQGQDENSTITGVAKNNNRLFLFTANSITKWDGQNSVPISTTIGCAQHECIQSIGNWLIFPHYSGIWAYNDSTGQLKLISKSIANWIKAIPLGNWAEASAIAIDNVYKIFVGTNLVINNIPIQGYIRLVYDFDMNVWSVESHQRDQLFQIVWNRSGIRKPYFQDKSGKILRDEDGYLDITDVIPWYFELGRDNYEVDGLKSYNTLFVYSNTSQGAVIQYQLDGGRWNTLGEIKDSVDEMTFKGAEGHDINFRFSLNFGGEPPIIEGLSVHYSVLESPGGR